MLVPPADPAAEPPAATVDGSVPPPQEAAPDPAALLRFDDEEDGEEGDEDAERDDEREGADDDLVDASGKILGKFKSVPALAKSYTESQRLATRKAQEATDYRAALEAEGYTFDADGKPVKAAPAPQQQQPQADPNAPPPNYKDEATGVEYDYLGMPVVSDDLWDQLEEEDPREYQRLRTMHDSTRAVRLENWRIQQAATQKTQQATQFTQARAALRQAATTQLNIPADLYDLIEAEADKLLLSVPEQHRQDPAALQVAMDRAAVNVMPGYYNDRLNGAVSTTRDAVTRQQKVVRVERGAESAPVLTPAPSNLTAEEKKLARRMGVSEEDYAAARSN